eukprot:UN1196
MEALFWPTYHVSPDVKVISLNWRSYAEYSKSHESFMALLSLTLILVGIVMYSMHFLPWTVLLFYLDPLAGSPVEKMMREGGPPVTQHYPLFLAWYHTATNTRRILMHWSVGLGIHMPSEVDYDDYFDRVRRVVPKENLLEWDMKRNTWEDLCKFVGVEECARTGHLPRAISILNFERDSPICFWGRIPFHLLLHRINWAILGAVISVVSSVRTRVASLVTR